jgi:hypothetical protein
MEWLFLTCHNYWIMCRLVRDNDHPFLAYSPIISIEGSSVPFRALLGAILSVVKTVSVEPSEFSPDMELDTIVEEQDEGALPEDDIDDGSAYSGSSEEEMAYDPPNTRNRRRPGQQKAESGLMVCPCLMSPHLSCSFTLRSPRLPKTPLNPSKFGCISTPSRTTCSPFLSAPRMGNGACG